MKITERKKREEASFGDLKPGDMFQYGPYLYLKIKSGSNCTGNAIRIMGDEQYHVYVFQDNLRTSEVEAELLILN